MLTNQRENNLLWLWHRETQSDLSATQAFLHRSFLHEAYLSFLARLIYMPFNTRSREKLLKKRAILMRAAELLHTGLDDVLHALKKLRREQEQLKKKLIELKKY
jgi:hypothetical protein